MKMFATQTGITLTELLLVLAIGGIVLTLSLRQYYLLREDAYVLQVQANVDALFQAAAHYYQANCAKGGQLDPEIATSSVKAIDTFNDLIQPGYLPSNFPAPNPIVYSAGAGYGYIVQFNKYTAPRYQAVCSNPSTCDTEVPLQIGTIVFWKIQVSVLLQPTQPEKWPVYLGYLSGNCLSSGTGPNGTVERCDKVPAPYGDYVAFERLPSYPTSNWGTQSTFWLTNPLLKQFNQMYTTNPITDLTTQSHTPEYQYFYCSS